ncbi:formyl transferase [Thermosynechococcus sichuanensis E542]|uniref:phosphoribosylglycinamide formyltransferase 1 n=1 Tax=Thermosynechococcus sichuanensis E542 TaxID=2016101 RepID=A0A7D6EWY3_9CYAN|nr:formyltransferase family protein [Thermosynechococcus vestitus]QLL29924.1 formyl transferase [Thermosynechococcus vestitus E542]
MKVLILSDNNNEYSRELIHWFQGIGEDIFVREDPIDLQTVKELSPDFVISYNYKHIISKDIVACYYPRIINLHISLLPYNRGCYPNVWSFLENTPKGVTIHLVDENVDTGDILLQKEVFIDEETETLRSSYLKLHREIQQLFKSNWEALKLGQIHPVKQEGGGTRHYKREFIHFVQPLIGEKGWDTPIRELKEKYRTWRSTA